MNKKHILAIILVTALSFASKVAYVNGQESLSFTLGACMVVVCIWGLKDIYDNFIKY